jgi:zinc protease
MKRLLLAFAILFLAARPALADDVQKIVTPKGIEVWFIKDHRLPILSLAFAFHGGMSVDPADKAGLAHFVSGVLDEGAGPRDSEAFQSALADNEIDLSFEAGRDSFDGSMRMLLAHKDIAGELLHDSLTSPHLDPKDVDRIRDVLAADLRRRLSDPQWVAQRAFNNTVFHGHVYGQPGYGSLESIAAITPDDLRGYIHDHFGRDQLVVTATGDMKPDELAAFVDRVFGDLPEKAVPFTVPEAVLQAAGQVYVIDKPIPESVLLIGLPGPKRDDPDWYAAEIMNYALGGGGFNSRLMEEVRTKRALTYGIGSSLIPYLHAGILFITGSTKNEDAGTALKIVDQQLAKMQAGGIDDAELKDARTYLTGSLALQMTSTEKVAEVLLSMRLDNLPIDYLDTRAAKFAAVTKADVARVAKRFLDPGNATTVVLGQPAGITPTATLPQ